MCVRTGDVEINEMQIYSMCDTMYSVHSLYQLLHNHPALSVYERLVDVLSILPNFMLLHVDE